MPDNEICRLEIYAQSAKSANSILEIHGSDAARSPESPESFSVAVFASRVNTDTAFVSVFAISPRAADEATTFVNLRS